MNTRQHAYLARALQDACGGVDACLNLLEHTPWKMGRSHLYDCRDPSSGRTMPVGAILFLEEKAGRSVYTPAICRDAPPPTDVQCADSESAELSYQGALLHKMVRQAGEDRVYTEHERRQIEPVLLSIEQLCQGVRAAMEAGAAS